MRFVLSVKFIGQNPEFYGPFDSEQQAQDWADGAAKAWAGVAIHLFPLESPWDA